MNSNESVPNRESELFTLFHGVDFPSSSIAATETSSIHLLEDNEVNSQAWTLFYVSTGLCSLWYVLYRFV
jgi:hypothetical protein